MTEFKFVSSIFPEHDGLEICKANGEPIKILQWQCHGELIADPRKGVYSNTVNFIKKAYAFLDLALEEKADLVLTPEYSFPYKIISKICSDQSKWPKPGKLWCLGSQGDDYDSFVKKLDIWSKFPNVVIIKNGIELASSKFFISPLIYLFRLKNDELCILTQLKTSPMADAWNEFEAPGLSTGKNIFVFDLCGNSNSSNRFLSLICADVLNVQPDYIRNKLGNKNILIFNPQLNQNPKHKSFWLFRDNFFEYGGDNIRIITLNWATGTTAAVGSKKKEFCNSWSAYYAKPMRNYREGRKLRNHNFKAGTPYAQKGYTEIWFSHPHEHCKLFYIDKGDRGNAHCATSHRYVPDSKCTYCFDRNTSTWTEDKLPCKNDLMGIIGENGANYDLPLMFCRKEHEKCNIVECRIDKCDYFFATCFAKDDEEEYKTGEDESLKRLILGTDDKLEQNRKEKLVLYKTLINLLKKNVFPEALIYLKDNHKFEIFDDYENNRKEFYNLALVNESPLESKDLKVLATIMPQGYTESDIQGTIKSLQERMDTKYRGQVLVYYFAEECSGYKYYDKHLANPSITKTDYSKDLASTGKKSASLFSARY